MRLIKVQRQLILWTTVFAVLAVAGSASGQTIGAPQVTVLPDNSVVLTYAAPSTPPAGTVLAVTFNGSQLPNIPIGTATTLSSNGPIAPGVYTVQVVWSASVQSPVTTFIVQGGGVIPPPPVMQPPVVTGNSVFLSWDAVPNATLYELEVMIFPSGQRISVPIATNSVGIPGVPAGNYAVRVRAGTSAGVTGFSNQVLVAVATTFRLRDLEISLTWNTESDIDLHIIEPSGAHVWWKNRTGTTVTMTADDTNGFGPELASIDIGGAAAGIYQVFIVHYRGDAPTVSNVAITIGVGTANPITKVITRTTEGSNATTGLNAALIDVKSGVISEFSGTRPTSASVTGEFLQKP